VGVSEIDFQERCRKVAGDCHRCAHERRCSRGSEPTGVLRTGPQDLGGSGLCRCSRGANPRGADAPRSFVRVWTLAGEIAIFAMHKRTSARAAGVSPPWFANRAGKCKVPDFRTRTSPSDCFPRGVYAPRSCIGVRTSAGEIAIFAVHKRMFTRAAGVSPPWCGHTIAVSREANVVQRGANRRPRAAVVSPPGLFVRVTHGVLR
jgi:hypothetical protein